MHRLQQLRRLNQLHRLRQQHQLHRLRQLRQLHTFKWFSLPMLVAALLSSQARDKLSAAVRGLRNVGLKRGFNGWAEMMVSMLEAKYKLSVAVKGLINVAKRKGMNTWHSMVTERAEQMTKLRGAVNALQGQNGADSNSCTGDDEQRSGQPPRFSHRLRRLPP